MSEASTSTELQELARLGEGGDEDRLHFRLVVSILVRCLRLLRPVRRHIIAVLSGFVLMAVIFVPVVIFFFDVLWTRVLQGNAVTELQAWIFRLDPSLWVESDALKTLSATQRNDLAWKVVVWGTCFTVPAIPGIMGLYYYLIWILQRINQVLRLELLDRIQSLSLRFHADSKVGDAIYRIYQDSAMVTQLIDVLILTPTTAIGRWLFCAAVVAFFDPWLGLLLVVVWPPTLVMGYWFSRRLRVGFRRAREANSRLTSRIQETLSGIKVIKAYGAEQYEQERFTFSSKEAFREAYRVRNLFAVFQVLIFWVLGTAVLTGTAYASLHTRDAVDLEVLFLFGGVTAWNLGLYNYFKQRMGDGANSTRDLYRIWGRAQDIAIGLDRVFEVLDLEPEVQDADDAVPLETVEHGVAFRDVHFAYEADRPVLEGVDLEAEVGTITAIVGPTGSGKSTLVALLLRLFDPTRGRVEIDGQDLKTFTTASLRECVSIALQENILFGDTVRENIRYAVPDASDEQVREAARVACADRFIDQLPGGYETLLGERGTKLSTGQRQRLSIARAVLKDTPILILDEPTASLDAATELDVLRNLADWGKGRAIFLITHRLSTIRRANRVAFLRGGRIEEIGSHDQLMAIDSGAYRSLVETEEDSRREELPAAEVGA